mgnify:CR=1 FL=1
MKLLVSDYDGTIKIERLFGNPYIPSDTISNIYNFINNGNKFMIATARPYDSIMNEVNKYNIPYNFISTLNGCIIYDNCGNVIYSKDMVLLDIEEFCKLYSCIDEIQTIKDKDKVLYYIFKTKFLKSSRKLINDLRASSLDIQSWFLNTYNIVHPISNKVDSINVVQELLSIGDSDIITIGDEDDDLEMIRNYYSYGIVTPLSNFKVLGNCDKKVKSLEGAFKHINKNI